MAQSRSDGSKVSGNEMDVGTPQGGVISPLLANLYLHDVLDVWLKDVVPPYLKGTVFLARFADDLVIGCEVRERRRRR